LFFLNFCHIYDFLENNSGYNVFCLSLGTHAASNLAIVIVVALFVLLPQRLLEANLLKTSSFLLLLDVLFLL